MADEGVLARPEGAWRPPQAVARPPRPAVEGSGHARACIGVAVGAPVVGAVAGWWLIGNQSVHSRYPGDLEYAYRAPDVPHWVVSVLGPVAVVLFVAIAGALIVAARRRIVDRRWLRVIGAPACVGVVVAGIGRIESAGTVGANIGGGLAIMFGVPILVALIVWTARVAIDIRRGT